MMRPYRNVSDAELARYGAHGEWDIDAALRLHLPSELLWVHTCHDKNCEDECRIKTVRLERIEGERLFTDFGVYSLRTGGNIRSFDGTPECHCHGRLYLLKSCDALSH